MLALLASGRDADVYAVAPGRVLRRYRDGSSTEAEAAVMEHVRAHGLAVPRVHRAEGPDLEMDRLDGPTMLESLLRADMQPVDAAGILATLHQQVHALPPLRSHDDGVGVVHLDLHPANVILTGQGPFLIDWSNADDGPADLDVAYTALILAQVATGNLDDEFPRRLTEDATEMTAAFLRLAGGDPGRMLERAVALRAGDPNLSDREQRGLAESADLVHAQLIDLSRGARS